MGYTITFLNSPAITIYHGENGTAGTTPQIGVTKEDDGNWYWTLNGDLLTDGEGNSIRANGDSAPVPRLSTGASLTVSQDSGGNAIVSDAIYLSVDEGKTWTCVSGTGGISFFSDVDTSDPTCVTFTLADGTSFSIARYTGLKLNFDKSAVHLGYGNTITVDFTAEGNETFTTDNLFIVAPDGWKASADLTTRASTGFSLTVTAPDDAQLTTGTAVAEGDILVMLSNGQSETVIGRIKADCKDTYLVMENVNAGDLASAIGNHTDMASIIVTSGTLDATDWTAVVKNNGALLYLDLEGADYTGDDADNLKYATDGVTPAVISIKLPQGVTGLGENAFDNCNKLTSITLPEGLTTIGGMAFWQCYDLTSITLPEGLTSIGQQAFRYCTSLSSITVPATVTEIESSAFIYCTGLTTFTCQNETPPTIQYYIFPNCNALTAIYVPAGSVEAYMAAAYWSDYADIIQAIP